jgi:hypothetical protein
MTRAPDAIAMGAYMIQRVPDEFPSQNEGSRSQQPVILTGVRPGQRFDEFKENVIATLRARGFFLRNEQNGEGLVES